MSGGINISYTDTVLVKSGYHDDAFTLPSDETNQINEFDGSNAISPINKDMLSTNSPGINSHQNNSPSKNISTDTNIVNIPMTKPITTRMPATGFPKTTVRSMPWLQTPMVPKNSKRRNMRIPKVVINPSFEKYAENISDPYWANIFNEGSFGKFPRGISFNNNRNILTFRRGLKVITLELSNDQSTAIEQCTEFIRVHSHIKSDIDIEIKKAQISECNSNKQRFNEITWASARRETVKRMLMLGYVNKTASSLNLSPTQRDQLVTTINSGIISGHFCSKTIHVVKSKIDEITGLAWDPHTELFSIDHSKVPAPKSTAKRELISENDYLRPEYKVANDFRPVNYQSIWEKVVGK